MSTSSLISLAKRDVNEEIPGLRTNRYFLKACTNVPTILHVEDSHYYKPDIDGNQDSVLVPSQQIVESIVHMHITSQLSANGEQHPAVFSIPNEAVNVEILDSKFSELMKQELAKQRKWFVSLVRIADDDWQTARKHNMISDIQRTAAVELGLKRDWLMDIHEEDQQACPFCGTGLLNSDAPICPSCGKVHNPAKLAELEARMSKLAPGKATAVSR